MHVVLSCLGVIVVVALIICVLSWLPSKARNRLTAAIFVVTFAGNFLLYSFAYAEMSETLLGSILYALHSTIEAFFGGEGYLLFELSDAAPHWIHEPAPTIAFWVLHLLAMLFDVMVAATIFAKKLLGKFRVVMALGTTNIVIGNNQNAVIAACNLSTHDGARPRGDWRQLAVFMHAKGANVSTDAVYEKGGVVLSYEAGELAETLHSVLSKHVIRQKYNLVFFQETNDDWVAFLELLDFLEDSRVLRRSRGVSLTIVTEREIDEGKLFPNGKPKNLDLKVVSSHKIVSDQLVDKLFSEDTLDGAVVKDGRVRIIFAGFGRLGQYVYSRLARECEARELVLEAHAFDQKIGDIEGPLAVRMDCRDDARLSKTRCDVNSVAFFDEVIRLSGDVERQGDLDAVIACLGSDDASARCAQNVAQLAERTESTTAVFAQQVQGHNLDFAKEVLGYDPFGAARLIYTEVNLLG